MSGAVRAPRQCSVPRRCRCAGQQVRQLQRRDAGIDVQRVGDAALRLDAAATERQRHVAAIRSPCDRHLRHAPAARARAACRASAGTCTVASTPPRARCRCWSMRPCELRRSSRRRNSRDRNRRGSPAVSHAARATSARRPSHRGAARASPRAGCAASPARCRRVHRSCTRGRAGVALQRRVADRRPCIEASGDAEVGVGAHRRRIRGVPQRSPRALTAERRPRVVGRAGRPGRCRRDASVEHIEHERLHAQHLVGERNVDGRMTASQVAASHVALHAWRRHHGHRRDSVDGDRRRGPARPAAAPDRCIRMRAQATTADRSCAAQRQRRPRTGAGARTRDARRPCARDRRAPPGRGAPACARRAPATPPSRQVGAVVVGAARSRPAR